MTTSRPLRVETSTCRSVHPWNPSFWPSASVADGRNAVSAFLLMYKIPSDAAVATSSNIGVSARWFVGSTSCVFIAWYVSRCVLCSSAQWWNNISLFSFKFRFKNCLLGNSVTCGNSLWNNIFPLNVNLNQWKMVYTNRTYLLQRVNGSRAQLFLMKIFISFPERNWKCYIALIIPLLFGESTLKSHNVVYAVLYRIQ